MNNNLEKTVKTKYPFSIVFYITLISFFLAVSIILLGVFKALSGGVMDGDTGAPVEKSEIYSFVIPASIIGVTWVLSLLMMLRQKFIVKCSFSVSDDGIHDILIGGIFLAFVVVIPIKFIPWISLKVDDSLLGPRLVVNFKKLENISIMKRLILRLKGLKLINLYSKLDENWVIRLIEYQENQS